MSQIRMPGPGRHASGQALSGGPATIVSLPRALSKLGYCSRGDALALIEAGRVSVDGRRARSAAQRVDLLGARISVDGENVAAERRLHLMLNKPRGLVTTRRDPQQRGTVYDCLPADLPFLAPVGRLDKASEGLLFLSNDSGWAEHLLNPRSRIAKTYHVRIDRVADPDLIAALAMPVEDAGEQLSAAAVRPLRAAARTSWIEIVLTEGRNRQVRRMLAAQGVEVLRLVRVAIGGIALGDLAKGQARPLTAEEVGRLRPPPAVTPAGCSASRSWR